MRRFGEHAVVLGAGMAGLLAARALTEAYGHVTIVDRDPLPTSGQPRKGVPQGRHAHVLLPRGQQALVELFPDLAEELVQAGAITADPGTEHRYVLGGNTIRPVAIGHLAVQASRPFIEAHVRRRVLAMAGVTLRAEHEVVGLTTKGTDRITGVRLVPRAAGAAEEELSADLVVDAMGRSGRTQLWTESLNQTRIREDEVPVNVAYASRALRLPVDALIEKAVVVGPYPGQARGMVLLAVEEDLHLLSLAGLSKENRPPLDEEGFLAYVESIAPPDVAKAIREAEPLGDIVSHRYPSNLRRRYERLRRPPMGLLVTGDALCSFNPVYGQGMSVAAIEALTLRACLAQGPERLARRFYRAAARAIAPPWRMVVSTDLGIPEVDGEPSRLQRLLNAYGERVQVAAAHDPVVAEQFMRVAGLLDEPPRLVRPPILRRVLRGSRDTT